MGHKSLRSGSCRSLSGLVSSAYRSRSLPDDKYSGAGFRIINSNLKNTANVKYAVRGGSWYSESNFICSGYRNCFTTVSRYNSISFRIIGENYEI